MTTALLLIKIGLFIPYPFITYSSIKLHAMYSSYKLVHYIVWFMELIQHCSIEICGRNINIRSFKISVNHFTVHIVHALLSIPSHSIM